MMEALQLTSCLFGSVAVHAYYLRLADYHHLFLALTVTSVLFHATHGDRIRLIDKAVAHLCYGRIALDTFVVLERGLPWLLLFPLGVAALWFGQGSTRTLDERNRMHLALHAVSILGLHAYLWALYSAPSPSSVSPPPDCLPPLLLLLQPPVSSAVVTAAAAFNNHSGGDNSTATTTTAGPPLLSVSTGLER
jgi:hypothetical protein